MAANSPTFLQFAVRWQAAMDAGLIAAAEVFMGQVKAHLARGYTTGAFTTGAAAESVRRTEPFTDSDGERAIRVGTDDMMQLYWELGGMNAYTRKFERVEHWRNAYEEAAPAMATAFQSAFMKALGS
jgi:hypothetical protein